MKPQIILSVATLVCVLNWIGTGNDMLASAESPPVITAQPQPQTAFIGANVNLRVSATSLSGVRYRWRFHGTNLPNNFPGQFTPLLSLREVTRLDDGPYSVVVSNSFGAVTSQTAVVTVNPLSALGVGFINLTAEPGYSLLTDQLIQTGTNQTVGRQISITVDGASLFKMDGTGFIVNNYLDGWSDPNMIIMPGEGWFFHNPGTNRFTVTLVGGIPLGRLVNRLPAGYSVCANIPPQGGLISSQLRLPVTRGAEVFLFDNRSQSYRIYESDADAWLPPDLPVAVASSGSSTFASVAGWLPLEPSIATGEAFWVRENISLDWIRDFSPLNSPIRVANYLVVQPSLANETGEINFFTYSPDGTSRVLDFDGVTPLNSDFVGQLYAGSTDVEASLVPIGVPVPFLNGPGAGYIRSATVKLPGVRGAQSVFLQLRVWEKCAGDAYENAVLNGSASGRSTVFSTVAHATIENAGPGLPPRNANLFRSFQISLGQDVPLRVARIQSIGSNVEICFVGRPGQIYCVQSARISQEVMSWTPVAGAEQVVGTGHVAKIIDTADSLPRFYRVCRTQ